MQKCPVCQQPPTQPTNVQCCDHTDCQQCINTLTKRCKDCAALVGSIPTQSLLTDSDKQLTSQAQSTFTEMPLVQSDLRIFANQHSSVLVAPTLYFVIQERLKHKQQNQFIVSDDNKHGFIVQYKESQLSTENMHRVWVSGVSRAVIVSTVQGIGDVQFGSGYLLKDSDSQVSVVELKALFYVQVQERLFREQQQGGQIYSVRWDEITQTFSSPPSEQTNASDTSLYMMSMMVDLHDITFGTDIAERVSKIQALFMQNPQARKMFVWEKDKQTMVAKKPQEARQDNLKGITTTINVLILIVIAIILLITIGADNKADL